MYINIVGYRNMDINIVGYRHMDDLQCHQWKNAFRYFSTMIILKWQYWIIEARQLTELLNTTKAS
jgi:hypothetical protein